MNRLRHQLFSGTAFAGDQHRRIGHGDAADELQDAQHPRIAADEIAKVIAGVEILAARDAFFARRPRRRQAQRGLDRLQHLLVGPRLRHEIVGACFHPFDGKRD
jgi:hypothetical protein